jgi:PKD repeat protein
MGVYMRLRESNDSGVQRTHSTSRVQRLQEPKYPDKGARRNNVIFTSMLLAGIFLLSSLSLAASFSLASPPRNPDSAPGYTHSSQSAIGRTLPQAGSNQIYGSRAPGTGTSPFWANITGAKSPPPTQEGTMAYDPAENETVLFGGFSFEAPTNTTWAYRSGRWIDLTSVAGAAPYPVDSPSLAYDAADGYLVEWGGVPSDACPAPFPTCNSTWIFENQTWHELPSQHTPPSSPARVQMVYDAADGYILMYDGEATVGVHSYAPETWKFSAGNWAEMFGPSSSSNPGLGEGTDGSDRMAYDSADSEVILYNGDPTYWGNNSTTWSFSGGVWSHVNTTLAPPYLGDPAMAFDASQNYLLFYGGQSYYTGNVSNETWEFRSGNWSLIDTPGLTSTYRGYYVSTRLSLAYDPQLNGTLAFGDSPTTWLWSDGPPISDVVINTSAGTMDAGLPVSFSSAVTGGIGPFTYAWNFGDGTSNSTSSPTHTYVASGTFVVTLNVTDSNGHFRTGTFSEVIHAVVSTSLTASPDPADAGLATQFTSLGSGGQGSYSYAWEFGDGTSSALQDPSHAYAAAGVYVANEWVNDSLGESARGNISISVAPALTVLNMTASPNPVDLGRPVNFSVSAGGGTAPYTYSWIFGDGGVGGNLSNITHIFTTNGPFVSTVRVVDVLGESDQASLSLNIQLNASIFANVSGGFAPLAVQFQGGASGGVPGYTYNWSFGDGTSGNTATDSHRFLTAGNYMVSLKVRDRSGHEANASTLVRVVSPTAVSVNPPATGIPTPPGWEIAWLVAALAAAAIVALVVRRRPDPPTDGDPSSPYQPYAESARPQGQLGTAMTPPRAKGQTSPGTEDTEDHLGDLF